MKLHLAMHCETTRHFESKKCLDKVHVQHRVQHFQSHIVLEWKDASEKLTGKGME